MRAPLRLHAAVLGAVAALVLSACGGGSGDTGSEESGNGPVKGGTITFLTIQDQIQHLDPQRNYTGEDLAFTSAYLNRTLTSYKVSTDEKTANELTPDLATDTGTPNEDATSWSFTLKEGPKWEDGSPITCEDVKYGVSRTFATDLITDGPQYAVAYLDIPKDKDGASVYKGPYVSKGNDTAAFDKAVVCDGNTITFNLANPVPDFNFTVTLSAFSPVPKAADTGEKYDQKPVSSGPYKVQEYTIGNQLVLVRNENWDPESDDYRGAYPDKVVVKFGQDPTVIDQRIIRDSGDDARTTTFGDSIQASNLAAVFNDPRMADRRTDEFDAYVYYYAVNVSKLPNVKHRQAIAAALDRGQIRTISGGKYAGTLADGVIKPNLPADYAESGMWSGLLGGDIPDAGSPELAKQLIEESGEPMPEIRFDYSQTPERDKEAAAVVTSLQEGRHQRAAQPDRARSVLLDRARPGEGRRAHVVGLGPGLAERLDGDPRAVHPGRRLQPLAGGRRGLQRQGAGGQGEHRPRGAVRAVEGAQQGGHGAGRGPSRRCSDGPRPWPGSKVKAASGENGNVYVWAPYSSWSYTDLYVLP